MTPGRAAAVEGSAQRREDLTWVLTVPSAGGGQTRWSREGGSLEIRAEATAGPGGRYWDWVGRQLEKGERLDLGSILKVELVLRFESAEHSAGHRGDRH